MWLNLLIILGTCLAVVVLGLFVYLIFVNIKTTLRANQSNSIKGERQTLLTITKDIHGPSLEQPLNEADYAPNIPRETDTATEDDDWLNDGIPEASASNIKKDDGDWLNAKVEEATTNVLPQGLVGKGEGLYDIDMTTDDLPPSYQNMQDTMTVKSVQEPVNQSHPLLDEISIRAVEEPVNQSHPLLDEISVRAVENRVTETHALMDEISIRAVENQVTESHALTDEITVRPIESPVLVSPQLMDEISIRPVENLVTESHALMDEISIKPSPCPVNLEYELLDDLITKNAIYRTKKAKPSSDAIITNPVESPVEKAEPVKTISVVEITEIMNEKRGFKQATIPSVATELRSAPFLAHMGEGMGNLLSQAKNLYKKAELRGAVTKALAALRIHNNNEFYIQDTNFTHVDTLLQKPQIKDFTFRVLNTATELDELIDGGYDLVMNFSKIKRGLKKGMVAFLILVDGELASMGWACMTEESKGTLRGYPYNDDLDGQACIVGDWTNPKFRDSGISSYVKHKRQQLLKEKGFTFERSIVEESIVKNLRSMRAQKRFELTYKRRTYTNVSLPGILGIEFWREYPLNETDTKPPYQMITLSVLVLPSPPMVADLNIKPKVLKLNWI